MVSSTIESDAKGSFDSQTSAEGYIEKAKENLHLTENVLEKVIQSFNEEYEVLSRIQIPLDMEKVLTSEEVSNIQKYQPKDFLRVKEQIAKQLHDTFSTSTMNEQPMFVDQLLGKLQQSFKPFERSAILIRIKDFYSDLLKSLVVLRQKQIYITSLEFHQNHDFKKSIQKLKEADEKHLKAFLDISQKHHRLLKACDSLSESTNALVSQDLLSFMYMQDYDLISTKVFNQFYERLRLILISDCHNLKKRTFDIVLNTLNSNLSKNRADERNLYEKIETKSPPLFIVNECHLDLEIASLLSNLGLDERNDEQPNPNEDNMFSLLGMVHQIFDSLFSKQDKSLHFIPPSSEMNNPDDSNDHGDNEPGSEIYLRTCNNSDLDAKFHKLVSEKPWEFENSYDVISMTEKNHILEAENKFIMSRDSSYCLNRLKNLANIHMENAQHDTTQSDFSENFSFDSARSINIVKREKSKDHDKCAFPSLPKLKVETYYLLRLLYMRTCKLRLYMYQNYFQSVKKQLLLDLSLDSIGNDSPEVENSRKDSAKTIFDFDEIIENSENGEFCLIDRDGKKFIYVSALDETNKVEKNILQLGSFFIKKEKERQHTENQHHQIPDLNTDNANKYSCKMDKTGTAPSKSKCKIDQIRVLSDLYECEIWFSEVKKALLNRLMSIYKYVHHSKENQDLIKDMLNLISQRPRVELENAYFFESYALEIVNFQLQIEMLDNLSDYQKATELKLQEDRNTLFLGSTLNSVNEIRDSVMFQPYSSLYVISKYRKQVQSLLYKIEKKSNLISVMEQICSERAVHEVSLLIWKKVISCKDDFSRSHYSNATPANWHPCFGNLFNAYCLELAILEIANSSDEQIENLSCEAKNSDGNVRSCAFDLVMNAIEFQLLMRKIIKLVYLTQIFYELSIKVDSLDCGSSNDTSSNIQKVLNTENVYKDWAINEIDSSFINTETTLSAFEWLKYHISHSDKLDPIRCVLRTQMGDYILFRVSVQYNQALLYPLQNFNASFEYETQNPRCKSSSNSVNARRPCEDASVLHRLRPKIKAKLEDEMDKANCFTFNVRKYKRSYHQNLLKSFKKSVLQIQNQSNDFYSIKLQKAHLINQYTTSICDNLKMEMMFIQLDEYFCELHSMSESIFSIEDQMPFRVGCNHIDLANQRDGGQSSNLSLLRWLENEIDYILMSKTRQSVNDLLGEEERNIIACGNSEESNNDEVIYGMKLVLDKRLNIVNFLFLPFPCELIQSFSKISFENGKKFFSCDMDKESSLRSLLEVYSDFCSILRILLFETCLSVVTMKINRSIKSKQAPSTFIPLSRIKSSIGCILNSRIKDLVLQMNAKRATVNSPLTIPECLDFLKEKKKNLQCVLACSIQTLLFDNVYKGEKTKENVKKVVKYCQIGTKISVYHFHHINSIVLQMESNEKKMLSSIFSKLNADVSVVEVNMGYYKFYQHLLLLKIKYLEQCIISSAHQSWDDCHKQLQRVLEPLHSISKIHRIGGKIGKPNIVLPNLISLQNEFGLLKSIFVQQITLNEINHVKLCHANLITKRSYVEKKQYPQNQMDTVRTLVNNKILERISDISVDRLAGSTVDSIHSLNSIIPTVEALILLNDANDGTIRERQLLYEIVALQNSNEYLRTGILAAEEKSTKLEMKLHEDQLDKECLVEAKVVDSIYEIIFKLEDAHREISKVKKEFESQKVEIEEEIRKQYEDQLRDLKLELISMKCKFEKYRARLQHQMQLELQSLNRHAIENVIEKGSTPMTLKTGLAKSLLATIDSKKIIEENAKLKDSLLKMKTMYELREEASSSAFQKERNSLISQLTKASTVYEKNTFNEERIQCFQKKFIELEKENAALKLRKSTLQKQIIACQKVKVQEVMVEASNNASRKHKRNLLQSPEKKVEQPKNVESAIEKGMKLRKDSNILDSKLVKSQQNSELSTRSSICIPSNNDCENNDASNVDSKEVKVLQQKLQREIGLKKKAMNRIKEYQQQEKNMVLQNQYIEEITADLHTFQIENNKLRKQLYEAGVETSPLQPKCDLQQNSNRQNSMQANCIKVNERRSCTPSPLTKTKIRPKTSTGGIKQHHKVKVEFEQMQSESGITPHRPKSAFSPSSVISPHKFVQNRTLHTNLPIHGSKRILSPRPRSPFRG